MPSVDRSNLDELLISSLPSGYLYNENLKPFIRGFVDVFNDFYKSLDNDINSLLVIDKNNTLLDYYLVQYGLPNIIFPTLNTIDEKVFAISMMRLVKNLLSKEDFENFILLLGVNIKIYYHNQELSDHYSFPYTFPMILGGVKPKHKLICLIYIEENVNTISNLGIPTPIVLRNPSITTNFVKNVLDFIKPDYMIFQYITTIEKELYGIV